MDAALRNLVRERAGECCEYCRLPEDALLSITFHVEHIRPRQHGGTDDPSNLALACPACNLYNGPNLTAIDPDTDTGDVVRLFDPCNNAWQDHFFFRDVEIFGVTPIGRATASTKLSY